MHDYAPELPNLRVTDSAGATTPLHRASSHCEAAAFGIAEFRRCGLPRRWWALPRGWSQSAPATTHELTVAKLPDLADSSGKTPRELAVRVGREILGQSPVPRSSGRDDLILIRRTHGSSKAIGSGHQHATIPAGPQLSMPRAEPARLPPATTAASIRSRLQLGTPLI